MMKISDILEFGFYGYIDEYFYLNISNLKLFKIQKYIYIYIYIYIYVYLLINYFESIYNDNIY